MPNRNFIKENIHREARRRRRSVFEPLRKNSNCKIPPLEKMKKKTLLKRDFMRGEG